MNFFLIANNFQDFITGGVGGGVCFSSIYRVSTTFTGFGRFDLFVSTSEFGRIEKSLFFDFFELLVKNYYFF